MNRILRTGTLVAAALALAPPLAAQRTETPAAPPTFEEAIDVRVVNVEVVVTDRDGNRVTGLGPGDLVLTVDGERVPIDYFTEVRGGVAVAAEGDGEAAVPGVAAAVPGEPMGTSYLVFIDDWFPIQRDRNHVLREMAADLSDLGAGDRMAVVAFDGRRVEMLTSWTGSRRELEGVFQVAMERDARGLQRRAQERGFQTGADPITTRSSYLGADEQGYANYVEGRVGRAVDAAVAALRGFARPPGRKVMLLLSGGWPYSPASYAVGDPQRPVFDYEYGYGPRIYQPLTDTANLLGYTLYPVDVPGMAGTFGVDASQSEPGPSAGSPSYEREVQVHATLRHLAAETGGRPLINAGRNEALTAVAADTRSYYWIGFTPDRRGDHAFHEIRVEAAGPGLKVRTREGYRDLSRQTENDMAVESALLFGETPDGGGLEVAVGEPVRENRRFLILPVVVEIPVEAMTLLPEPAGTVVANLELRVAAVDERDRQSDVATIPFAVRLRRPPPDGETISYPTRLRLRNQEHDVVLSLHDPIAGSSRMTRIEVAPAPR
jgi:VWFA-related protein